MHEEGLANCVFLQPSNADGLFEEALKSVRVWLLLHMGGLIVHAMSRPLCLSSVACTYWSVLIKMLLPWFQMLPPLHCYGDSSALDCNNMVICSSWEQKLLCFIMLSLLCSWLPILCPAFLIFCLCLPGPTFFPLNSVFNVLSSLSSPFFAIVNSLLVSLQAPLSSISTLYWFAKCALFFITCHSPFLLLCIFCFFRLSQMGVCTRPCHQWEVTPAWSVVLLAPRNSWRRKMFGCWVSRWGGSHAEGVHV